MAPCRETHIRNSRPVTNRAPCLVRNCPYAYVDGLVRGVDDERMTDDQKRTRFAVVLRRLRSEKGWSQQALAEAIGVSPGFIGQVETKPDKWPSDDNITATVEAMGLTATEEQELRDAKGADVPAAVGTIATAWVRLAELEDRLLSIEEWRSRLERSAEVERLPGSWEIHAAQTSDPPKPGGEGMLGGEERPRPGGDQ